MSAICRMRMIPMTALPAIVCMIFAPGTAAAGDSLVEALSGGAASLDFRYRFEHVGQDNALRDANAATLRSLLGYETGAFRGLSARLEFNSTAVAGVERYNSGPGGNQRAEYSVVADPKSTRVNQAYVDYAGLPATVIRLGNQRIILDNARFIGNVGFRQQEQTYIGARIINKSLPRTTIDYAFVRRVNRVFHDIDDTGVAHHFVNARYVMDGIGALSGYGYFLDYEETAPASSTATLGARLAGDRDLAAGARLLYTIEAARQEDHGSFSGDYRADYRLIELGAAVSGVTVVAGHETLGSDGDAAKGFETRLATLHAHNGWADQFLATPATGLRDASLTLRGAAAGVQLTAVYHDFRADRGGARYGAEWGLQARKAFGRQYALEAKYASYRAKDFSVDTEKLWLTAEIRI